jgi:predicted SnoaL-like aldol condensation-catalyzing enzyme
VTTLDANKAVVRRFVEDVFTAGRTDTIEELVAPEFVSETFGITDDGPRQLEAAIQRVHGGLDEVVFTVEDMLAEGDRVAVRLTASATPTGEFMGVDAAGKRYTIGELHLFRLEGGRIIQHWHHHDVMGLMRQLGAGGPST